MFLIPIVHLEITASGISACEQTQTIAVSRRTVTGQGSPLLKRLSRSSTSRASETGAAPGIQNALESRASANRG
jgi:hypothetical protein